MKNGYGLQDGVSMKFVLEDEKNIVIDPQTQQVW